MLEQVPIEQEKSSLINDLSIIIDILLFKLYQLIITNADMRKHQILTVNIRYLVFLSSYIFNIR